MKAYIFLADGFETVEALAVVDVLKRSGVEAMTVSINEIKNVISAQKIEVIADKVIADLADGDMENADLLFLPGGMPGTLNLEKNERVKELIKKQFEDGRLVGAICAAPSILGHLGILKGKKATCFPGFEKDLEGALHTGEGVEIDGNVVTGKGMGTAVETGLALVEVLCGAEKSSQIRESIQHM